MEEHKELEKNHIVQPPLWLLDNTSFCNDGEFPMKNDKENKQHTKKNIKIAKKLTYTG